MQGPKAVQLLGGSVAIYVILAARSAGSVQHSELPKDGGSGSSSGGADGARDGPSVLDALADPVSSAAADPNQSGSRLNVNYYAGTDGSKLSRGTMHDSMLNVDCSFLTASDGTLRCMPTGGAGLSFFADSACSHPFALQLATCSAPLYAVSFAASTTGCGSVDVWHVFPITGAYTEMAYYSGTPSSCTGPTTIPGPYATYNFYSVGAELPPSTFVQATVMRD